MCSRIKYETGTGTYITGRGMDWNDPTAETDLWVLPKGMERDGGIGENPVKWTSKYGSVVTSFYNAASSDGMNERGLVANVLYLAEADYGTDDYQRGFQYFGEETYKNSYQWDSLFKDGAMWKHGNLAQGLYVDPKRDVVGAYFSTNPLTGVWDRSGGYIRAAAKLLAGG